MGNCIASGNQKRTVHVQKAPKKEIEANLGAAIAEPSSDASFEAFYPDLERKQTIETKIQNRMVHVQKAPNKGVEEILDSSLAEPSDGSFQALYPDLKVSRRRIIATDTQNCTVEVQKAPQHEIEDILDSSFAEPSDGSFQAFYPDLKVSRKQQIIAMDTPPTLEESDTSSSLQWSVNNSRRNGNGNIQETSAPKVRLYAREA